MGKTIVRTLILGVLSIAILAACGQRTADSIQVTSREYGPAAEWRPTEDDSLALNDCFMGGGGYQCVLAIMRSAKASPEAILFAEQLGNDGYMGGFEEFGAVDVATVIYPGRANGNLQQVLVNGSPDIIRVEQLYSEDNIKADPRYSAFIQKYPDAFLWPPDGGMSPSEAPTTGWQRFLVSYPFYNGCRVCGDIGRANFALDFDSDGRFLGVQYLGLEEFLEGT